MLKMNNLSARRFLILLFMSLFTIGTCNAQLFHPGGSRKADKVLFGKSLGNKRQAKVKEPRKVLKAKKKQEKKEKQIKRDYAKSVKRSQRRSIEIQSPEVQARMKQNKKDSANRAREKRKRVRNSTKKAGRKYN
jgi:hypothetical protein